MKTIIILESTDNIGKTYLARQLCKEYGAKYWHFSGPISMNKREQYDEQKDVFFNVWKNILLDKKDMHVFDRSPFGEFVYCKIRGYDAFTYFEEACNILRKVQEKINIIFIVIYADKETYSKFGIKKKKEELEHQKSDKAKDMSKKFVNVINKFDVIRNRLVINSNNYESLDERNDYIRKQIYALVVSNL